MENKSWFQLQSLYKYIRIQAANKKFLKYLEISATFLLIIIFLIFAVFPTITTISALLGDIKTKEATIVKMNTKISNILQAQESYGNVQDKYDLIESSFPSNPNFYKSASSLSSSLKNNSVKVTRVSFDLSEQKDVIVKDTNKDQTYLLNINGTGQYSDILKMVKQFLNNRRLADLNKIQISKSDDAGNSSLNVNLVSDLHYLPIEK
jgi:Tfp pilus assembly protein PilO